LINNDILRRLRYALDLKDSAVVEIISFGDVGVTAEQVDAWLKREEDDGFLMMKDSAMLAFLNGLIIFKRGRRDGVQLPRDERINNNLVLQKLRIALNFQAEDVLQVLELADFRLSKHELRKV